MTMCTSPLRAFYTGSKTEKGGDLLAVSKTFSGLSSVRYELAQKVTPESFPINKDFMYLDNAGYWQLYKFVDVPCGHCDECREAYARAWSDRCMLEANHSKDVYFLTLTYSDSFNPGSLRKRDLQLFMKRLRKQVGPGCRFFASGEYGPHGSHRPHYHLVLFNCPLSLLPNGHAKEIDKAWPYGFHVVDVVTPKRCAYVAGYTSKKLAGWRMPDGYEDPFILMSRRPGIGERWLSENLDTILDNDRVYFAFSDTRLDAAVPRYADKLAAKRGDALRLETNRCSRGVSAFRNRSRLKSIHHVDDEGLLDVNRTAARHRKEKRERDL